MKKIIGIAILVVILIMGTTACVGKTTETKNGINPEANHYFIDSTKKDYKATMSGKKLRSGIDSTIEAVTEWGSNAVTDTVNFAAGSYDNCAKAVTGVAKDIEDGATTVWNSTKGFVDGFFG